MKMVFQVCFSLCQVALCTGAVAFQAFLPSWITGEKKHLERDMGCAAGSSKPEVQVTKVGETRDDMLPERRLLWSSATTLHLRGCWLSSFL